MIILTDTCDFLWFISDDPRLPVHRREAIQDPGNMVFLSTVSSAEISIKHSIGKLPLPSQPAKYIRDARLKHGISSLPLAEEATLLLADLPLRHKDPFDRMLICQALAHGMTFITSDPKNHLYDLPLL